MVIISPWKRAGPFTWTNLNSNDPRLHCAKFGWNWPCASGEEDFLNFVNLFSLFGNYLLLEKGRALYFNKLESPSPKDALCQVWLKLAQWFWRRRSLWQLQWPQQQQRWTTDKFWSEKLTWAFGSGELKIHNYTRTLVTKIIEVVSTFVSSFVKIEIPFTQFQLKMPWWFWRRFLRVRFSPFSYYLHFKKDMAIHLNKLVSPLLKNALSQAWM